MLSLIIEGRRKCSLLLLIGARRKSSFSLDQRRKCARTLTLDQGRKYSLSLIDRSEKEVCSHSLDRRKKYSLLIDQKKEVCSYSWSEKEVRSLSLMLTHSDRLIRGRRKKEEVSALTLSSIDQRKEVLSLMLTHSHSCSLMLTHRE